MSSMRIGAGTFSGYLQMCLRRSGYSQKELATELGLHAKVLSRKLNGSGNAVLTDQEVRRIIKVLAHWRAITTQDEALQLLNLAHVEPSSMSSDEWASLDLVPSEFAVGPLAMKNGSKGGIERSSRNVNNGIHWSNYQAFSSASPSNIPFSGYKHNLPAQTTRLIGREWVVERLHSLLRSDNVRLVTLFGSGGSGKTRLALQVANDLVSGFSHGVWFVALGGVNDATLVPMSIFQALHISPASDIPPLQSLMNYLRNKQLLLVLDNFEQVGEAATLVDQLLAAAPGLKVLVTSRVVLHLSGEHEFSVPPLDVPGPNIAHDAMELMRYAAVQLFVERAQAVVPEFVLTAQNVAAIAQICAKVDGLPLALELAAARVKVFPPAMLLERLSQKRLPVLTRGARNLPHRQQTLRNTISWSYNLLSKAEQVWFARLGVFSGGWSLGAAEAMMLSWIKTADLEETTDSISPAEMLEQLVDSSLLVRLPATDGESRFSMLETIREFALEKLTLQGEFERLRDWHACYYLEVAEAAEIGLRGPQQLEWLERFTADRDNFRAAFEWSLQRAREGMSVHCNAELLAVEVCLRLASALRHYWEWQGNLAEARYLLGEALGVPIGIEVGKSLLAARAKALSEASRLACLQNDQVRAAALAEESIAIAQELEDPIRVAGAQIHRGWAAQGSGEYEVAKDAYQRGLDSLSTNDDPWMRAQLLFHLAPAIGFTYDFEQMRLYYSQGKELFEQLGDKSSVADLLKDQGAMALLEADCVRAVDGLLTSLKMCYELGHKQHLTTGMCWLSLAVGMSGYPDLAAASRHSAQLEAVTEGLEEIVGLTGWTKTHPLIVMVRKQIRTNLDEQSWEAAWNEGKKLTIEQAIELASQFRDDLCSSIQLAQP